MPNRWLLFSLALFILTMAFVKMAATYVVGTYGIAAGLAVIALMIFGGHLIDRSEARKHQREESELG